ncbi:TonB-dependent receptor plug domain-containing protein [Moritella viscosa]|uniref:TonB-dependent receptor plug domain-containing protein n=1 Tax=Moritella viscosa TaxID=80854 RepID=UPI00094D8890|nr:TonB-dependent receptor [Moritella viscosa]
MKKKIIALSISLFAVNNCTADTLGDSPSNAANKPDETTKEVVVIGQLDDGLTSKIIIDRDAIKNTPSSNGNVTDLLKSHPNVRFENNAENGFQGGEIKPVGVSINGAETSQTAYMVDGINVNNDIDPLGNLSLGSTPSVIPGLSAEQAYFFDASMLGSVTVYDSNVPANLGGFTGGAVVSESLNYSGMDNVSLNYRTTNNNWASVQVDDTVKAQYTDPKLDQYTAEFQPKYKKAFLNAVLEKGLTDELGLVVGISRRDSRIQQSQVVDDRGTVDRKDQTRRSDNMMTNFRWLPNFEQTLDVNLRYSSYKSSQFWGDQIGNDFVDGHLAYGTTLSWDQRTSLGSIKLTAAYDKFEDRRDSNSSDVKVTINYDDSDDVISTYTKGGYGDSQLGQENSNIKLNYITNSFYGLGLDHKVSSGVAMQHTQYNFERFADVNSNVVRNTPWSYDENNSKVLKGSITSHYSNYAFYVDDSMTIGSVSIRPGVRIEQDDYLKNMNVAPRFSASWQALENTRFTTGFNRYYGRSFAAMKLAVGISELSQDTTRSFADIDNFKTPHSDEFTFGIDQNVNNIAISARYIRRINKDRLTLLRTRVKKSRGVMIINDEYVNSEDFTNNIYTLQVSNIRPWIAGNTLWDTSLGFDWFETNRSDLYATLSPDELVALNGELMTRRQMDGEINSTQAEWIARTGINMKIPDWDITWSNNVFVKAPVQGYDELDNMTGPVRLYKSYEFNTHTQWDSRVRWQPATWKKQNLFVQIDVSNILNETRRFKTQANSGKGDYGLYSPGRQFWLEVGYNF